MISEGLIHPTFQKSQVFHQFTSSSLVNQEISSFNHFGFSKHSSRRVLIDSFVIIEQLIVKLFVDCKFKRVLVMVIG